MLIQDSKATEFIQSLQVSELPSVGWKTSKVLKARGIVACSDLAKLSQNYLENDLKLGPKTAEKLYYYCRGIDKRPWEPRPERKSISAQISWGVRMSNDSEVEEFLVHLSIKVVKRMKALLKHNRTRKKAPGNTGHSPGASLVSLKVWRARKGVNGNRRKGSLGHGICDMLHRSVSKSKPTSDEQDIAKDAFRLYKAMKMDASEVRGMGVVLGNFGEVTAQGANIRNIAMMMGKRRPIVESESEQSKVFRSLQLPKPSLGLNHHKMVAYIVENLRKATIEPEVLPFLDKKVSCCIKFCDGLRCSSFVCFQRQMVDSVSQILFDFCEEIGDDLLRKRCLVQGVKQIANCILEKDSDINRYWQSSCDQLKFAFREDVNVLTSSQVSYDE